MGRANMMMATAGSMRINGITMAKQLPVAARTNKPARGRSTSTVKTGAIRLFDKKAPASVSAPAQSFEIRIPGKFLKGKQAQTDVVLPISLGFTEANELFVGRMAMLGFAASLVGEVLTGKGALAQFDVETGLPLFDTEPLVLGLIAFNLFAAFAPGKGKFIPDQEESLPQCGLPPGPKHLPRNSRKVLWCERCWIHEGERAFRWTCCSVGFCRIFDRRGHHWTGTTRTVQPRDGNSTLRR